MAGKEQAREMRRPKGVGMLAQLAAFAFWRQRLRAEGAELWQVGAEMEAKIMNQAPLYALAGERVDFYLEAPLAGATQVDLSAQYFAEAFVARNPLERPELEQEGNFFHYYAKELARVQPSLLEQCNLYLEADINPAGEPAIASFINLSGDVLDELLLGLLAYRGRMREARFLRAALPRMRAFCEPWHFGFMDARSERPLRLVLQLKRGLPDADALLQCVGAPPLTAEARELLHAIGELGMFSFMLDLDVQHDGAGATVGVELIPNAGILPAVQQSLFASAEYARLCALLERLALADERLALLPKAVFAAPAGADAYLYSRLSHFKLRWRDGVALPAKIYVQMRPVRRQRSLNEALRII